MLLFYSRLKVYLILIAISIAALSSIANGQTNIGHGVSISLDSTLSLVKSAKQKNILSKIKQRKTTENMKIFKVNDINELKKSTSLRFGDKEVIYSVNNKEAKPSEGNTNIWKGKSNEKEANMTTLVFSGNDITGSVWLKGKLYKIQPLGDGIHAFFEFDLSKPHKCAPPLKSNEDNNKGQSLNKSQAVQSGGTSSIDVLVAYTTAAKNSNGNINSLIQLAVEETNQSYKNSDVNVRLNLVYTYEVNYTETGDIFKDLGHFWSRYDTTMNDVHNYRNLYSADVCVLITDFASDYYAGLAYTVGAYNYTDAFCVVVDDYATVEYTFAHEIGHLQYCRHDRCSDTDGWYPYQSIEEEFNNHAKLFCGWQKGTIMNTEDPNSCCNYNTIIQYWSNPNKTYNGAPMGTVDWEDNARTLNEWSPIIEDFRTSFTSGVLPSNQTWYYKTLSGNVTVPSGKTLTLGSIGTINLNGYSIVSTGGTIIDNGITINGLKATLKSGSTIKGYYGSVQSAVNNCSSGQTIYLEPITINENVSINYKNGITISGWGSTLTGRMSISNSDDVDLYHLTFNNIYNALTLNGCDYFNGLDIVTNNSSPVSLYNCSFAWLYGYFNNNTFDDDFALVINNSDGWVVDGSEIRKHSYGAFVSNYSYFHMNYITFCQNIIDACAWTSSYVDARSSVYSGNPQTKMVEGYDGYIDYDYYYQTCGMSKSNISNYPKDPSNNLNKSEAIDEGKEKFTILMNKHLSLLKEKRKNTKKDEKVDNTKYQKEFRNALVDFKKFISEEKTSKFEGVALTAVTHIYRLLKDYEGMNSYLESILQDKGLENIKGLAERYKIDYFKRKGEFDKALSLADELIKDKSNDPNFISDVLYAKGLLYQYSLNNLEEAKNTYISIVNDYRDEDAVILAKIQLENLGVEVEDKKPDMVTEQAAEFNINNNYPNPFNPATAINYSLPSDAKVEINVYDILGRKVADLVNEVEAAGKYTVNFDGSNLASGVYFYSMKAAPIDGQGKDFYEVKKMILTK